MWYSLVNRMPEGRPENEGQKVQARGQPHVQELVGVDQNFCLQHGICLQAPTSNPLKSLRT